MSNAGGATPVVDVLIATAIPVEREAVLKHLDACATWPHLTTHVTTGYHVTPKKAIRVAVLLVGQGNPETAATTSFQLLSLAPTVAIFVGIAGGLKDLDFGDVIAGDLVYYTEMGKQTAEETMARPRGLQATTLLSSRAKLVASSGDWIQLVKNVEDEEPRQEALRDPAQHDPPRGCLSFFLSPTTKHQPANNPPIPLPRRPPRALVGPIASQEKVLANLNCPEVIYIKKHFQDAKAVEMEGYGFLQAIDKSAVRHAIVVRGISDKLTDKKDDFHKRASATAAAFAFQLLREYDQDLSSASPAVVLGLPLDAERKPLSKESLRESMIAAATSGISELISAGKLAAAEDRLEVLMREYSGDSEQRDLVEAIRLKSLVLRRTKRVEAGAQCLVDLEALASSSTEAASAAAYGYYLKGNLETARALSGAAVAADNNNKRTWLPYILARPEVDTTEALATILPNSAFKSAETYVALAANSWASRKYELAAAHAEKALELSKETLTAAKILGFCLWEQLEFLGGDPDNVRVSDSEKLAAVIAAFTEEIERCKRLGCEHDAVDVMLGRAAALAASGDQAGAERDRQRAHFLYPEHPAVQFDQLRRGGGPDGKLTQEDFAKLPQTRVGTVDAEQDLQLAIIKYKRGDESLKLEAYERLRSIWAENPPLPNDLQIGLFEILIQRELANGKPSVDDLLKQARERGLPSWFISSMSAQVLRARGDRPGAQKEGVEAFKSIGADSSALDRLFLARVLFDLNLFGEAAQLFLQVLDGRIFDSDAKATLKAAFESRNFTQVLEFAEKLRAAGHFDPGILEFELDALVELMRPDAAYELAERVSEVKPNDRFIYLLRCLAAARVNKLQSAGIDPKRLPALAELAKNTRAAKTAVAVLRLGGHELDAIDLAYEVYRLAPMDYYANLTVIQSMTPALTAQITLDTPTTIDVGTYFEYTERAGQRQSYFIEGRTDTLRLVRELSASEPLAKAVIGKKVKDTFGDPHVMGSPPCTITALKNRYVARYQEVMAEFDRKFPGQRDMAQLHVDSSSPEALVKSLEPLAKMQEERSNRLKNLEESYRAGRMPIHALCQAGNRHVFDIWLRCLADGGGLIPCWNGDENNESTDLQSDDPSSFPPIVLEETALATIAFLGLSEHLVFPKGKLVVSSVLRASLEEELRGPVSAGNLSFDGSVPIVDDIGGTERRRRLLQAASEFVSAHCSVLEPQVSTTIGSYPIGDLRQILGRSCLSTVALAMDLKGVLWTDDLFVSLFAKAQLGLRRLRTEQALDDLAAIGRLSQTHRRSRRAQLAASGIWIMKLLPSDWVAILDLEIDENRKALVVRKHLGNPHLTPGAIVSLLLTFATGVDIVRRDTADQLTDGAINTVNGRPDAKVIWELYSKVGARFLTVDGGATSRVKAFADSSVRDAMVT